MSVEANQDAVAGVAGVVGASAPEGNAAPQTNPGMGNLGAAPALDPAVIAQEVVRHLPTDTAPQGDLEAVQEETLQDTTESIPTEGLFNSELPEDLQGNPHIEGLFRIAKAHFPELDLNRVMSRAWESGDPELIDMNHLREVVGEDYANYYGAYFQDVVEGYQEHVQQETNQWAQDVFESVGGKDTWLRIADVFNSNADQTVSGHVQNLLNSRNQEERDVGVQMILNFVKPYGILGQQGRSLGGHAGAALATGATGLSREQFQEQIKELTMKGELSAEKLEELRQMRMLGAQAGL